MRTIEGPFCVGCGKELKHVESSSASVRPGYWDHVAPVPNGYEHRASPQWRVIKNAKA